MSVYISKELRRLVHGRAGGCCEYCLIPETAAFSTFEADHIIGLKHGGATNADNLALSCSICNKYKGSDIASIDPETGEIVKLYHPRINQWNDHFILTRTHIVPLTPSGRATARLLQFNTLNRIRERELLVNACLIELPIILK